MATEGQTKQATKSSLAKAYLIAYNTAQAVGWGLCLAHVVIETIKGGGPAKAYRAAAPAAGEIFGAARRRLRANVLVNVLQETFESQAHSHQQQQQQRATQTQHTAWMQSTAFVEILHAATGKR